MIYDRVREHQFHPINPESQTMTFDRGLDSDGIADLSDDDWKVRLLALRDLVRLGVDHAQDTVRGLEDPNFHVRYLSAKALGVLQVQSAAPVLEQLLRNDEEPIVRAYAAMALGQMDAQESLDLLRDRQENDPHRDVRHQCSLAIGQIESGMGATEVLRNAFTGLDESTFEALHVGQPAIDFTLDDTEGRPRALEDLRGDDWLVLIWVFADWCPVCHGEFQELIEMRESYEQAGIRVATVETHDTWRGRVMVGKEIEPGYWFARESFKEADTNRIWWPQLLDRAGAVGAAYGVDPMAFAVHGEFINRPATVIIDPDGIVRFAYYGAYWGDRPSIEQTLEMIKSNTFDFEHPSRLSPVPAGQKGDQPRP